MQKELRKQAEDRMQGAVDALKREMGSVRTGRASLALLEGITVDYYGSPAPLSQVAALHIPESRQILITPWDPKLIPDIERAIMKSDLGLTPQSDGKNVRINIPQLTEERRKELVKVVRKKSEEAKVAVRNIRRDVNEQLKKLQKEKALSEDDLKKSLDEVQKITDSYIEKVDSVLEHKEKEIMEV
ncbi:MAG: ribosome recycling factor [Nitrospirota bacterium]|jgi:ribosome recycling factor